jgi:hypothetical protein
MIFLIAFPLVAHTHVRGTFNDADTTRLRNRAPCFQKIDTALAALMEESAKQAPIDN